MILPYSHIPQDFETTKSDLEMLYLKLDLESFNSEF